jgi:hypothetical protein
VVEAPFVLAEAERLDERPLLRYTMVAVAVTLFGVNGSVSKVVLGSGLSSLELAQIRSTAPPSGFLVFLVLFARHRFRGRPS